MVLLLVWVVVAVVGRRVGGGRWVACEREKEVPTLEPGLYLSDVCAGLVGF